MTLLVIDDLFGRTLHKCRNLDRSRLCGNFLLNDVTGDEKTRDGDITVIASPVADAFFFRGQSPSCAQVGSVVENDLDATMDLIRKGWSESGEDSLRWSMVLLDLCFYTGMVTEKSEAERGPGMPIGRPGDAESSSYFGLVLLREISRRFPGLPVVILSSKDRQEVSREFSAGGAIAFVPRAGIDSPNLLAKVIAQHSLVPDPSGTIVGRSVRLLQALRNARRAAATGKNILIRGESGTGKELLAKYLHDAGRAGGPLVKVNCGGMAPGLMASELFGHVKGAFTGADAPRVGQIVTANGGDLFLDEIGALDLVLQATLLRVLEDTEVTPVGANKSQKVKVRFLSATDEDIEGQASSGLFRDALLHRLRQGATIELPPLRERLEDLPLLVEKLLRESEKNTPGAVVRTITGEAIEVLEGYDWPGNIRELGSVLGRAVTSYPGVDYLEAIHIELPGGRRARAREVGAPGKVDKIQLASSAAVDLGRTSEEGLEGVIRRLEEFRFEGLSPAEFRRRLRPLEEAFKLLLLRYVKACVESYRNSTVLPGRTERVPYAQPVRWMVDDDGIKPLAAKQLLKRIFKLELFDNRPAELEELLRDEDLRGLYEIACGQDDKPKTKDDLTE